MKSITSDVVADRLIDFCAEHGDLISNLKLQKLLYYAQAWYLALNDMSLFPGHFEAWDSGPAFPSVFIRFRQYNGGPIQRPTSGVKLPKRVERHIGELMEAYGALSAFDLERLSKSEEPWLSARRNGTTLNPPIDETTMTLFYQMRKNEQKA